MKLKYLYTILIIFTLGCSEPDDLLVYTPSDANHTELESNLVDLYNVYRVENDLYPVSTDELTRQLAKEHTEYMISEGEISHSLFGYRSSILINLGAKAVGEVLGYGYKTNEEVIKAWINSEEHNRVLLGPYTHIGVVIIDRYYVVICIRVN